MNTLAIIGGGAAGLAAAVEAATQAQRCGADLRVVVYEADEKVGRSILRSGNGRCNFSNAHIQAWDDASLAELYQNGGFVAQALQELERTGADPDAFDACPLDDAQNQVLAFFRDLGLAWRQEGEGRLYPYANKAQSLLDALRAALADLGVDLQLESAVDAIEVPRDGARLALRMADGAIKHADQVVVAVGGTIARKLLSDQADFLPTRPVLGPLAAWPLFEDRADAAADPAPSAKKRPKGKAKRKQADQGASAVLNGLDNIRVRCNVSLRRHDQDGASVLVAQEQGEVLFRKYGLSGIAVFNLSRFAQQGDQLVLDLLPELSADLAASWLARRADRFGISAATLLQGFLLPNVAGAVCRAAGVRPDAPAIPEVAAQLARACKGLAFAVQGIGDAKQCQVHRGGVDVAQVSPRTLQLRSVPAIRVVGEALDVDAPCGGYNLHWAWGSGLLAARSAVADASAV